jgi:hypothetical protein
LSAFPLLFWSSTKLFTSSQILLFCTGQQLSKL